MSQDPRQDHLSADETEPDPLTDCISSAQLKQTLAKTDTPVGPSGDYQFSIQSTYTLRSVVAGSSRKSSGDSMDDELYGLNDDFIEKLNVVRKKLNLIEISDDDNRLESTPICSKNSAVADSAEKEESDSKGNTINKFYNIYQLNYINQNVEFPETNCTAQDSYYEITETEIKKRGLHSWSVALDEFKTIFEVPPNVEKEPSLMDYLQLTYNPPKKKICKRVHTPILSAASNNEHIDLPYSLRVGMDTDLLKTNSRHYLHTKCTQYCGTDIFDGDATHSLLDLDKAIEDTQIELCSKSAEDSTENSEPLDIDKDLGGTIPSEHITRCVHLMPQVEVKIYGSESPLRSSSSSSRSSSDNEDAPSPPLKNSLRASDFLGGNDSKYHINLITACSSSSSAGMAPTWINGRMSSNYLRGDREMCASNEESCLHSGSKLPNVPFERESTCSSPVSNVTTLKRSKSLSAYRTKMINQSVKARVSDSCVTIKTLKSPKPMNQRVRGVKHFSSCDDELFDAVSRTSRDSLMKNRNKSSSTVSSSVSACVSDEVLAENLAISPLITASLDVPRMFVKKYKYPPIAYIATCLGQASSEKVEQLMQQHTELSQNKEEEWWKNSRVLKNSDSTDSYKETAMQMMQRNNYGTPDKELVKEKQSELLAASQKSLVACNMYNLRKSQAQNIEFYDQNTTKPEADKINIDSTSNLEHPIGTHIRRIRFADEQTANNRPSRDRNLRRDDQSSEPDSDAENQGSCFACGCFKNIFTSRETQFFA